MPSFTETLTVAHNLAQTISTAPSSVYDKARKYTQRSVSWKKTFDEAGVALLGGYDAMMEPKRTSSKVLISYSRVLILVWKENYFRGQPDLGSELFSSCDI